jgi:hypothetical protein
MGIVKTGLYSLVLSGDDQMKAKSATHNYLVLELHPVNTKKNISMTSANHEADDPILSRLSFAFFFLCVLLCGGFFIKVYFLLFRRRLSTAGDIAPGGIVIVMMCRDVAVVGS